MTKHNELWITFSTKLLLHKTIVAVRVMTDAEMHEHGWTRCAVMFRLNTGEWVYPSQDNEGNGPGALFTTSDTVPTIPTLRPV